MPKSLETYDTQRITRLLLAFVDGLTNWCVRRSRRRFRQGNKAVLRACVSGPVICDGP